MKARGGRAPLKGFGTAVAVVVLLAAIVFEVKGQPRTPVHRGVTVVRTVHTAPAHQVRSH